MRVFLLGIDGLTFRILDPLIEKGYLPNFARLKQEGSWGILKSTVPPVTPVAWMSIATGLKPAKHGVLDFWDVNWENEHITLSVPTHRRSGQAIWDILSGYDSRVAVVNVPCTYPPDALNGVMVSGFSAPSIETDFTYPPDFKQEILDLIPNYKIDIVGTEKEKDHSADDLLSLVQDMTEKRIELLELILNREEWNFIFFTLVGPDRLQHSLWSELMQGSSPDLVSYFQKVDGVLSQGMEWVEDEGLLLIVSDHGFRSADRVYRINQLLARRRLTKIRESVKIRNAVISIINKLGLRMAISGVHSKLFPQPYQDQKKPSASERLAGPFVLNQSKLWALASDRWGYTTLFRQPVSAAEDIGEDIAGVVAELQNMGIVSPEGVFTGEALHTSLGSTEATGPCAVLIAQSPWAIQGRPRPGAAAEAIETIGVHDMDGCLLAWGRGVKAGPLPEPASVLDVAPTVLYAFDLPMESDFDGQPLTHLFTFKNRIRTRDRMTGAVWEKTQRSDSVRKKLEMLLGEKK